MTVSGVLRRYFAWLIDSIILAGLTFGLTMFLKYVFEDGKVVCKVPDNIEKVFSFSDAIREMNTYFYFDMSAWAKIYKRELFDNIRFPVGRLSEDFFIMYNLLLYHKKSLIFQNLYIIICKEKAAF